MPQCIQIFTQLRAHHLVHTSQTGYKDAMGHPVKSLTKVKNTPSQSLSQSFHHRMQSSWSGMICPCKSVLVSPSHLFVLHLSGNSFLEYCFHRDLRSDVRLTGLLFPCSSSHLF